MGTRVLEVGQLFRIYEKSSDLLLRALFPVHCISCSALSSRWLCGDCIESVWKNTQCIRCHSSLKSGYGCLSCADFFKVSGFFSCYLYENIRAGIIFSKKNPSSFPLYCRSLLDAIMIFDLSLQDIVFVPSSRSHWLELWLSDQAQKRLCSPFFKNRDVLSQKHLNQKERWENSVNLFSRSDDFQKRHERVILIDDVISTGASLIPCISLLKEVGYNEIRVFSLSFQNLERGEFL